VIACTVGPELPTTAVEIAPAVVASMMRSFVVLTATKIFVAAWPV
jgi:hypothetical protein